jgi:hypothetical protein
LSEFVKAKILVAVAALSTQAGQARQRIGKGYRIRSATTAAVDWYVVTRSGATCVDFALGSKAIDVVFAIADGIVEDREPDRRGSFRREILYEDMWCWVNARLARFCVSAAEGIGKLKKYVCTG